MIKRLSDTWKQRKQGENHHDHQNQGVISSKKGNVPMKQNTRYLGSKPVAVKASLLRTSQKSDIRNINFAEYLSPVEKIKKSPVTANLVYTN